MITPLEIQLHSLMNSTSDVMAAMVLMFIAVTFFGLFIRRG